MAAQRSAVALSTRAATIGVQWTLSSLTSSSSITAPAAPTIPASCILCQRRAFGATAHVGRDARPAPRQPAAARPTQPSSPIPPIPATAAPASTAPETLADVPEIPAIPSVPAPTEAPPPGPLENAPRSYGKRTDEFTPTPLSRPIGMHVPPMAGENSGIDARSLQQKRDDFVNYEKHLVRRQELKNTIAKPYFRDWSNLQFHKGKTFLSPPRLFRGDVSLYFPNLVGQRLLSADKVLANNELSNTTPMLQDHAASVVTLFSSLWAENQMRTFVSPEANPALAEVLDANRGPGAAQLLQINIEENAMRAWLIRRFRGSLRKRVDERDWENYLLVRRGINDSIRESIGLLNSKVGYVYLVDRHCRIRWAGSGPSDPEERQSLAKGVQRLLTEAKSER